MTTRKAEPRDIPVLVDMMFKLTAWLKNCGQWAYAKDSRKFMNGINAFVVGKLLDEVNSLVLVGVDENDDAVSMLIGGLRQMDPFFEHNLIVELLWLYPLNINSRQMERELEKWGIEKGATAMGNYSTPGNTRAETLMIHEGRKVVWNYLIRPTER
jgi:hypothetical protein